MVARRFSQKPLQLIYALYLDEQKLLRNGVLPGCMGRHKRLDKGHLWLASTPGAYRADGRKKLKAGKCVVRVRRGGEDRRFMLVDDDRWRLPDGCKAAR